jgi:hypothetical protein
MELKMNEFDKILDDLLIKYNYYESCPDFLKYVQAKEIIPGLIKRVQIYEQITIVSLTPKDRYVLKPYLGELVDRVAYIDLAFPLQEKDILCLRESMGEKKGIVLLVSFLFYREFAIELHKAGIETISLYEYFITQGLCFSREFYSYRPVSYTFPDSELLISWMQPSNEYYLFYQYRSRYEQVDDPTLREFYLRSLIFICIDMRDFIYASKYLEEYRSLIPEKAAEILEIETIISKCLSQLQSKLHERQQNDLILFLLDSLEYGDDAQMPFLHEQSTRGITFENAYTVTPNTNPTLRTILCEKTVIDDQSFLIETINREQSPIIRFLEDNEYFFTYFGFSDLIDFAYKGQSYITSDTSQSRIYWLAIGEIISSTKPVCVILHELTSTHEPYISNSIHEGFLYCSSRRTLEWKQEIDQKKLSAIYTDEQLSFYSSFFPKQVKRIYFSDHGTTRLGRIHTILTMQWEGCPSYTVSGLFSYINFSKLLKEIINDRIENLHLLCTDYLLFQDVDKYNPLLIDRILHQGQGDYYPQLGPSYRGIVTNDSIFIRYRDGSECYWRTITNKSFFTQEELKKLRCLAGEKFLELENYAYFQYSRRFTRLTNHYKKRTGAYEERKLARIKQLFEHEYVGKKIAIRGGGFTTFQFLLWGDLYSHVDCIVDLDKNALVGKLGFEVLTPQEAYERPIDLLITLHEGMYVVAQSEPWTCPLMDLIALGKAEGILTTEHYGNWAITAEDIEASR